MNPTITSHSAHCGIYASVCLSLYNVFPSPLAPLGLADGRDE